MRRCATSSRWCALSSNSASSNVSEKVRSGVVGVIANERDDDRRIEAAGQIGADRHVGAQLQAHRIDQQLVQLFGAALLREAVVSTLPKVQSQ